MLEKQVPFEIQWRITPYLQLNIQGTQMTEFKEK